MSGTTRTKTKLELSYGLATGIFGFTFQKQTRRYGVWRDTWSWSNEYLLATTKAGPDSEYLAGVISTAPAYLMNKDAEGQALALVGRVPVRVTGSVTKGQAVFASHNGTASTNGAGKIVGIALETNSDLGEKNVECMLKV